MSLSKKMNLRTIRIAAGLSQTELARRIGVNQSSIADWERGKCFPEIGNAIKLAKTLHCSLDELFVMLTGKSEAG